MADTRYRGLGEFGLPLVTPNDPSFDDLVCDIESRPGSGPAQPPVSPERAAVLVNNTGKPIIVLAWFWRYTGHDGKATTSWISNFGSSAQRDVLMGRSSARRDINTFILPGSKRLLTEQGTFGNNLDVLTHEELPRAQGYCGGWGGGSPRERAETALAVVELVLDLVILEDGLCVGPNESGLYEAINESFDLQRTVAQEAIAALEAGESVGKVFEIVRPWARHNPARPRTPGKHPAPVVQTFSNEAIHHLTHANDTDLHAFFKKAAEPRSIELRRPI